MEEMCSWHLQIRVIVLICYVYTVHDVRLIWLFAFYTFLPYVLEFIDLCDIQLNVSYVVFMGEDFLQ